MYQDYCGETASEAAKRTSRIAALSLSPDFHFHRPPIDPASSGATGYDAYQQAYYRRKRLPGFNPHSEVLHRGWNGHNARPLPCDVIVDHDLAIKVRDGCTFYRDV
jgi:hypothetical protein